MLLSPHPCHLGPIHPVACGLWIQFAITENKSTQQVLQRTTLFCDCTFIPFLQTCTFMDKWSSSNGSIGSGGNQCTVSVFSIYFLITVLRHFNNCVTRLDMKFYSLLGSVHTTHVHVDVPLTLVNAGIQNDTRVHGPCRPLVSERLCLWLLFITVNSIDRCHTWNSVYRATLLHDKIASDLKWDTACCTTLEQLYSLQLCRENAVNADWSVLVYATKLQCATCTVANCISVAR